MITVVDKCDWLVHDYGAGGPNGGIHGQLTHCRVDGVIFYVRENSYLCSVDQFCMSAGARQGRKMGDSNPGEQVLELAAPPAQWERLAELVHQVDPLHRRVRRNRRFTIEWARWYFAQREWRRQSQIRAV